MSVLAGVKGLALKSRSHQRRVKNKVVVRLGGDLKSQMIQCAPVRSIALWVQGPSVLDGHSEFARVHVSGLTFGLGPLPIITRQASLPEGLPFFLGDGAKFVTGRQFKAAADIERTVTKMAQTRDGWRDARLSGAK